MGTVACKSAPPGEYGHGDASDAALADGGRPDAEPDSGSEEDGGEEVQDVGSMDRPDTGVGVPPCIEAEGPGAEVTSLEDGPDRATVTVSGDGCTRRYALGSTAPLRDHPHANPRVFEEQADAPAVRTNNQMFDALYALALEEAREASVDQIRDGAFRNGAPLDCAPGGCFETGRLWNYVWTRDTAYAVDLGLAPVDPIRARNSLDFKLSARRDGSDLQIVQDTGTGGSYPVSTDRVVWALGAARVLPYLDPADRQAFEDRAFEAMKNTVTHDREVVFDPRDGLYRGEESFLDWREQTYPPWVMGDVVHVGMAKALSTNVGHLRLLEIAAELANARGEAALAATWSGWADDLRTAIRTAFDDATGSLAAFVNTDLDGSAAGHHDLLASALAVLSGVVQGARAAEVVASYPHTGKGPPVIWPQQQEVPIYHNRGIWPFVTAYWLLAAKAVDNDAVFEHALWSLMRGAALNLSNMENLEMVTGRPWVDDGPASGPVVNSQRQLWSVAGYLAMVHRGIFGIEATSDGLAFSPFVTEQMRRETFAGADTLVLNRFPFRGKTVSVVLHLPAAEDGRSGSLTAGSVTLNGGAIGAAVSFDDLEEENLIEIELIHGTGSRGAITMAGDPADYKNLFAPRPPNITGVTADGGNLRVDFDGNGEAPADVAFNVYRDGVRVASGLTGSATSWTDQSATPDMVSHCYAVESYFTSSGNVSQHSRPWCWWGNGGDRVSSFLASSFTAVGGSYVVNHGRGHYESWGDAGHSLTLEGFTPAFTGPHLLQVVAGNGAGPTNTGITCAVKRVEVVEEGTGDVAGTGHLMMPHAGSWDQWRDSSFVPVDLRSDRTYRIVIRSEPMRAVNMSVFQHFADYTGGTGGPAPFNRVNIAELKILSLTGTP